MICIYKKFLGLWPYEHYKSEDEIHHAIDYPSISAFHSSLCRQNQDDKNEAEFEELREKFSSVEAMKEFFGVESFDERFCVSPKEYYHAKNEFEEKILYGQWHSMFDTLKSYNLNDCQILFQAFCEFRKTVKAAFGTEVLSKITLPALSEGTFLLNVSPVSYIRECFILRKLKYTIF